MKKALKIILILAIVAAVGFLGLVAIYFIQKKPVYYTSYENAGRYTAGSTTLEAGAVDEIDISWLSGTVRFLRFLYFRRHCSMNVFYHQPAVHLLSTQLQFVKIIMKISNPERGRKWKLRI